MQDKFHIETYREHEIWYNANSDKFTVELLVEENWRERGRKSLVDCRKAIDDHIKSTLEFKPLKCLFTRRSEVQEATIKSVRSDGGVVVFSGGNEYAEISAPLEQLNKHKVSFYQYNPDYIEWAEKKEALIKKHKEEIKKMDSEAPKLEPLDMSFITPFIKPH